jgi:hypothetical protein
VRPASARRCVLVPPPCASGWPLYGADDLLREPTPPPGVEKGRYNITYDLAASIFRASSRGLAPYNNVPYDLLLAFIGSVRRQAWS